MSEKLLKYFRIQVNLGKVTEKEVKAKYPEFTLEDDE